MGATLNASFISPGNLQVGDSCSSIMIQGQVDRVGVCSLLNLSAILLQAPSLAGASDPIKSTARAHHIDRQENVRKFQYPIRWDDIWPALQ
jgi:hypothetical protein